MVAPLPSHHRAAKVKKRPFNSGGGLPKGQNVTEGVLLPTRISSASYEPPQDLNLDLLMRQHVERGAIPPGSLGLIA